MKCKFCGAEVEIGKRCEYCGSMAEHLYYADMIREVKNEEKPTNGVYIVKSGDNLWNISKRFYGTGLDYHRIVKANRISNPNLNLPRTEIKNTGDRA